MTTRSTRRLGVSIHKSEQLSCPAGSNEEAGLRILGTPYLQYSTITPKRYLSRVLLGESVIFLERTRFAVRPPTDSSSVTP